MDRKLKIKKKKKKKKIHTQTPTMRLRFFSFVCGSETVSGVALWKINTEMQLEKLGKKKNVCMCLTSSVPSLVQVGVLNT